MTKTNQSFRTFMVLTLAFCCSSMTLAQQKNGEGITLNEPICIYIPIPQDQHMHVAAPTHSGDRIVPTAEFIINFPVDIDLDVQNAFQYAVDIWSYQIASDVPIEIDFSFSDLAGNTLGSAGPTSVRRNFSGAPEDGVWYPIALANKLAGTDLDESQADIEISFDSGSNWYFGTDGNTPSGQYDFVSVVLHELGHGLGFVGSASDDGTDGSWGLSGYPLIYDGLVTNSSNQRPADFSSPSTSFHDYITSNDLYIDGLETFIANGDADAKLYAPTTFDAGSSYSHWDESTYNGSDNALMTPQIGSAEAIHDIGNITRALFKDMGWETKPNTESTAYNLKAFGLNGRIDITWSDNSDDEVGFIIQRSTSESSGFVEIDTVNADILIYNDMTATIGSTYYYKVVTLGENDATSDPSDMVSATACGFTLPTGGTWTGMGTWAINGGQTTTNPSITFTNNGNGEYTFSDITGGLYTHFGQSANQSFKVIEECGDFLIGSPVSTSFAGIGTNSGNGFGPGSYDEATETLILPWYDNTNSFGGTTTFTRNGDATLETPTIPAAQIAFSNVAAHSMDVSWTNGNGNQRLVLVRELNPIENADLPVDATSYMANSSYPAASMIGETRVVYNGNEDNFTLTGLTENTLYFVYVFEYNNESSEYLYLTSTPAANSQTTLDAIVWDGSEGDGDWANAANWTSGTAPSSTDNAVITSTGTPPIITTEVGIENLEIEEGASLTVNSGGALAIYGSVFNYGNYTVERNTTGDAGYSIVGTPVTEALLSDLFADYLYSNDGTGYSTNLKESSDMMIAGQGYFAGYDTESPSITFAGMPNTGDISITVDNGQFELVSNPYSAAISIDDFLSANSSTIAGAVYFWDDGGVNVGASRGGDFIAANGMGSTSIVQPDDTDDGVAGGQGSSAADNGYIPSVQGVFVEAIADGTVVFSQDQQVTTTGSNNDGNYYRNNTHYQTVRLALKGNGLYNEIIVGMTSSGTFGRDHHLDAKKLEGGYPLSFYSLIDGDRFSIQGLPLTAEQPMSAELGFDIAESGSFELSLIESKNLPDHMEILVFDKMTGVSYNMQEASTFEFTTQAVVGSNRFELTFQPKNVLAATSESGLSIVNIRDGLEILSSSDGVQNIAIYTIDGQVIFNDLVSFSQHKALIHPKLHHHQAYILRVNDEALKFLIR